MTDKDEVIAFFGGTPEHVAIALGIGAGAVRHWPLELPLWQQDRVLGAAIRTRGLQETRRAFPNAVKN